MPIDPNQPSTPTLRSWFYNPDGADIHVFGPSGLWNLSRFAPPEPVILRPPALLRHPREAHNATENTVEPHSTLLEEPSTPQEQHLVLVLLPDTTVSSPTPLPLEMDHRREALHPSAMQEPAIPSSTPVRPVSGPSLAQEDSAFALTEAPTPHASAQEEPPAAEQEVDLTLMGAPSSAPYADH